MKRVILFFLFFISFTLYAQNTLEQKPAIKLNSLSISVGSAFVLHSFSGYYEHSFIRLEKIAFTGRTGFIKTYFPTDDDTDNLIPAQVGVITGKGKNHFEVYMGGMVILDNISNRIWPSLSLGYRWQSAESNFIFRAGIAFPETQYLGVGLAF